MCGVYGLFPEEVRELKGRYNLGNMPRSFEDIYAMKLTPRSRVLTVSRNSPNRLVERIWGLAPLWVEDPYRVKFPTFNARSEEVATKATFRSAWKKRQRCILPASYFIEWETVVVEGAKKPKKIPHVIRVKGGEVFGFAGLYEVWRDAEGMEVETCTMLTTRANGVVGKIHNRQPVILHREDEERWLERDNDAEEVGKLLMPLADEEMEMWPIDEEFNKAKAESVDREMLGIKG